MALTTYDSENEIHKSLLSKFKTTLNCDINNDKDELLAKCFDYVDSLELVIRDLAVEELDCDPEITNSISDSYWSVAIVNSDPKNFEIICGFEYIDPETDDDVVCEFVKCGGEILIEDETDAVLSIDLASLDYSTLKDYNNNKNKG